MATYISTRPNGVHLWLISSECGLSLLFRYSLLYLPTHFSSILAAQNANIPLQIVAVTESGGVNAFFNNEICQFLITEGNALADRYKGSFMTFSADQYVKCKYLCDLYI